MCTFLFLLLCFPDVRQNLKQNQFMSPSLSIFISFLNSFVFEEFSSTCWKKLSMLCSDLPIQIVSILGHSSTESGIQEHWFNRIAVSLTAKSKWTNLRTNQQFNDGEEEPKLSASKDASLAVGSRQFQAKNELLAGNFQRNEFVRNNRSPSVLAPQYQSQISKNYLTRTDSTAQNVWFWKLF